MDAEQAIAEVLGEHHKVDQRTDDHRENLFAAARRLVEWRIANTERGAAIFTEMAALKIPSRLVEEKTGVPKSTAHSWGNPPPVRIVP